MILRPSMGWRDLENNRQRIILDVYMCKGPLLCAMLLVALSNILPVWVFAQRRSHAFSSRDFHFTIPARSVSRPATQLATRPAPRQLQPLADAFQVNITTTPAACDVASGTIVVEPSGGTPPYTYSFDRGPWQNSGFAMVVFFWHNVAVKDATGAIVTRDVLVDNGGDIPSEYADFTKPSACDQKDGNLTISAWGGTPPYQYSLDRLNWQTSPTFDNLYTGTYQIFVKDAKGCIEPGKVFPWSCISLEIIGTEPLCNANDGAFTVAVTNSSGYNPPYLFSLDDIHYQSTGDFSGAFSGLTYGIYNIYIKDGAGNKLIFSNTLRYYCGMDISGTATDATCGQKDGTITAKAVNGSAPYRYSIDGLHFQAGNVFSGLSSGLYTVMAIDAAGNKQAANVQIKDNCPTVTVYATDASCANDDGEITAVGGNGTPFYKYSKDGGAFQSNPTFSGLPSGVYSITIKDANNFTADATVTVNSACINILVTPHAPDCGQDYGSIDLNASGGQAPYHYSLNGTDFQDDPQFAGLVPGSYTVTVKDNNGKTVITNATVDAAPLPAMDVTTAAATCANNDGSLQIVGTAGPAPYQYALDGGDYASNGTMDHVSSGSHQVYIKDAGGCIASQAVNVPLNNNLTADGGPAVPPICEGKSGMIQASSNGTSFNWQPATGLNDPHVLQPTASPTASTTYTLTASLGACQKTATVDVIVNPAPVAAAAASKSEICYGQPTQLNGGGRMLNYTYRWTPADHLDDPSSANPTVRGLTGTTTYHLAVTDDKGCQSLNKADVTITVTPPPRVFAGNDTSILLGQPLPLHAVDVDKVGLGDWVWNPSDGLDNDVTQNPIARPQQSITYTVTGRTYNDCVGKGSITVTVYTASGIFVPNAFTPNGDGNNDMLRPILVGMKELKYFAVFDRWGRRVFYTTNAAEGWRGHGNGQDQPMGTYVWMVGGVDLKGTVVQQKGTVLLIR